MRVRTWVTALAVLAGAIAGAAQTRSPFETGYLRVPDDNPLTESSVRLGRRLFFDPRLSADGSLSCATCHLPERAFADNRPVAVGLAGRRGHRNVPPLVNRAFGESFFWDGRADTLEAQVLQPIDNPVELGSSVPAVVERLQRDASYVQAFDEAYGPGSLGADALARALASYVRSIRSGDSRVDRHRAGDASALTPEEQRGLRVFGIRGLCTTCHLGATMTDERFHNTGISWDPERQRFADDGRFAVTGEPADRGAVRTPSLRDVSRTAPYMHDGSLATLEEVVEFYDQGGRPNPYLDSEILRLDLTAGEKAALVAFLRALDGTIVEGVLALRAR